MGALFMISWIVVGAILAVTGISEFDESSVHGGAILNSGGGTQAYFDAGLLTHYGFARAEWPGCVALSKFAATWNETAPARRL